MSVRLALIGLLAGSLLSMAGCEIKPQALVPVAGRVTYAGAAVTRGVIVFAPDSEDGNHGACATGEIGLDGRYTLTTDGSPGAIPGWHRVTIAGLDSSYGPRLPDRLRDPKLSKLRVEVVAGRENALDFKLEGQ
jgi:hypothetical protein